MLIQFNFRNFRSYKEDAVLDFTATKYTEHSGHIIEAGREKILPAAVVFGANGSGKTNLLRALKFMKNLIDDPETADELRCFGNESMQDHASLFEVYFIDEKSGKTYRYGFILETKRITEEWLDVKSRTGKQYKPVISRTDHIEISGISQAKLRKAENACEDGPVLPYCIKEYPEKFSEVSDFFSSLVFISGEDPVCTDLSSVTGKELLSYVTSFDPSVTGIRISDQDIIVERMNFEIPLSQESEGFRRMLALYPRLEDVLLNGKILAADNLGYGLHSLLLRNIIITFLHASANPHHAQLIMTTHDSRLLSNHADCLRRDEIWFASKNEAGESTLYSLAEFADEDGVKIRKDENHEKNYMNGKYGAVPQLDYIRLSDK